MDTDYKHETKRRKLQDSHNIDTNNRSNNNTHSDININRSKEGEDVSNCACDTINNDINSNSSNAGNSIAHIEQASQLLGSLALAVLDKIPMPLLLFTRTRSDTQQESTVVMYANDTFGCVVGRTKETMPGHSVTEFVRMSEATQEAEYEKEDKTVTCQVRCADLGTARTPRTARSQQTTHRIHTSTHAHSHTRHTPDREESVIFRRCSNEISLCFFSPSATQTTTQTMTAAATTTSTSPETVTSTTNGSVLDGEQKLQLFEVSDCCYILT